MEVETTRQLYKIIDKTLNFIEDKNRKDIVNKSSSFSSFKNRSQSRI